MEEREIDLVDLIADILSHWRGMLVCMLAGAILMGVFSYVRSSSTDEMAVEVEVEVTEADPEERLQILEDELTEAEKAAVLSMINDEQKYQQYQQYIDQSVRMKMDPYNMPERTLIYIIGMEDIDQRCVLGPVYENLINSTNLYEWVGEQTGISANSLRELISTYRQSSVSILGDVQEGGAESLKIRIIHYDERECEKIAQAIKDYIEGQYTQLAREMGAHELTLLSESAGIITDTQIWDQQVKYYDSLTTLRTNIAKVKTDLSDDQAAYYELLTLEETDDNDTVEADAADQSSEGEAAAKPSISKKYVLVGAVLFAFVYAGIFFVLYVLNGKLRAVDELQSLYHISQLGLVVKDEGKKKIFIDKWIDALRNRSKRRFTEEQSLQLAAAAVKISAGKQGLDTVYLMGCDLKAGAEAVCQKLKELLAKENITAVILDNVLYDAAAMEELEHAKGIVLVEKAMSTMYDEISRELELASRQGIKVLGGIIVE